MRAGPCSPHYKVTFAGVLDESRELDAGFAGATGYAIGEDFVPPTDGQRLSIRVLVLATHPYVTEPLPAIRHHPTSLQTLRNTCSVNTIVTRLEHSSAPSGNRHVWYTAPDT